MDRCHEISQCRPAIANVAPATAAHRYQGIAGKANVRDSARAGAAILSAMILIVTRQARMFMRFATRVRISIARSRTSRECAAVTMVRTRALPSGTVGEPMPVA